MTATGTLKCHLRKSCRLGETGILIIVCDRRGHYIVCCSLSGLVLWGKSPTLISGFRFGWYSTWKQCRADWLAVCCCCLLGFPLVSIPRPVCIVCSVPRCVYLPSVWYICDVFISWLVVLCSVLFCYCLILLYYKFHSLLIPSLFPFLLVPFPLATSPSLPLTSIRFSCYTLLYLAFPYLALSHIA